MPQFTVNLSANVRRRLEVPGSMFLLRDQGAAPSVEVRIFNGNLEREAVADAETGFEAKVLGGFTHVDLLSTANAALRIIITDGTVDFDFFEGSNVNIVSSIGDPVFVSPVDPPAVAIADGAAVAVTDALTAIAAADANRRALRFANIGTDAVALGGAGLTWAKRVIVLYPGDTWIEDRAGNLAWSAICDAGKTASVTTQGISV